MCRKVARKRVDLRPKCWNSITLHTCLYLEKKFPAHRFHFLDAGQRIKALEKDFTPALEAIRDAELILFCNGHRTVTMGTPFGYLIVGDYAAEENLRMRLEARAQVGGNFLAGVATDEADVDKDIDTLAATVAYAMERQYTPPQNFLGVGGMKIFRDLIYMMRGLMRADHKFFKSHGQYDFPQKKWKTSWMMYLIGGMMNNPRLKQKLGSRMSEGMIAPYKKILDDASFKDGIS